MSESTHKVVVAEAEGLGHYGLCLFCGDRGEVGDEQEASDWAAAHVLRARQGNLAPLGNTQIRRETAAKIYRARSTDARWSAEERAQWAKMAEELEERPDEGQDALF